MKTEVKGAIIGTLLMFSIWAFGIIGWGMNIYKLTKCDFKPSVKAEFIRALGIVVPPVGAIAGYLTIEDK